MQVIKQTLVNEAEVEQESAEVNSPVNDCNFSVGGVFRAEF